VKVLDLFCGGGGAAVGYKRAGAVEIIGVDLMPQPRYPFDFIRMDAMEVLDRGGLRHRSRFVELADFDLIHASPPCQRYSVATLSARRRGIVYPDLYLPVRDRLVSGVVPWVIENVIGSPAGPGRFVLCGSMFGLTVRRHRTFEWSASSRLPFLPPCAHVGEVVSLFGDAFTRGRFVRLEKGQEAMGIDWMRTSELCEAIPPAYTEWVGRALWGTERVCEFRVVGSCRKCGQAIPFTKAGRPREFCSDQHRYAWHATRRRVAGADHAAAEAIA
jgi:DNA (cytosine-5)-methyltransferase 1